MDSNKLKLRLDDISEVNPALTCYHRDDPAPVLPLRDEPDLLSWLENTGRLILYKYVFNILCNYCLGKAN